MHAGRTSAVVLMSGFDNFYSELDTLVKSFKKNDVMIKLEPDLESQIIRIFGEKITALGRAKTGLGMFLNSLLLLPNIIRIGHYYTTYARLPE